MASADDMDRLALDAGYVCVGALRGAHGVKGLVKVASFTEDEQSLFDFATLFLGPTFKPVVLTPTGAAGDLFLCRGDIIASREMAQSLKGQRLYAPRLALEPLEEEDDFFLADLIGLEAQDLDGKAIGHVRAVEDFGAGDLLEVTLVAPLKGLGKHIFIPFTKKLVPLVAINERFLRIDMLAWQSKQVISSPDRDGQSPDEKS